MNKEIKKGEYNRIMYQTGYNDGFNTALEELEKEIKLYAQVITSEMGNTFVGFNQEHYKRILQLISNKKK